VGPPTDLLITTNNGNHAVGVTATPVATLTDLSISTLNSTNPSAQGQCPADGSALKFATTPVLTAVLPGISATKITGVVPSSDSADMFVTYTGTGGVLPLYMPAASGPGALSKITLSTFGSAAPVAPVAGVFSSDNNTFYVGTSGDNLLHILTKNGSTFVDTTKPITPNLPGITSGIATPNLVVQKPRKIT
jgi:trimeric autotransporter adhesin